MTAASPAHFSMGDYCLNCQPRFQPLLGCGPMFLKFRWASFSVNLSESGPNLNLCTLVCLYCVLCAIIHVSKNRLSPPYNSFILGPLRQLGAVITVPSFLVILIIWVNLFLLHILLFWVIFISDWKYSFFGHCANKLRKCSYKCS